MTPSTRILQGQLGRAISARRQLKTSLRSPIVPELGQEVSYFRAKSDTIDQSAISPIINSDSVSSLPHSSDFPVLLGILLHELIMTKVHEFTTESFPFAIAHGKGSLLLKRIISGMNIACKPWETTGTLPSMRTLGCSAMNAPDF